jgi:hypothetical protein
MTIDTITGKKAITQSTSSPFVPTILTTPGSAALRIKNSELPVAIQVDETTNHEVARRLGAGVQVYDCALNSSTFKFREPQATLYDLKTVTQRGIHFATETPSPNWADADGSRVVCKLVTAIDAPPPADPTTDVRWLKVEAVQHFGSNGVFSNVTFIQRVLTFGGQAPPSCATGTTVSVPYTALYIFWAPK